MSTTKSSTAADAPSSQTGAEAPSSQTGATSQDSVSNAPATTSVPPLAGMEMLEQAQASLAAELSPAAKAPRSSGLQCASILVPFQDERWTLEHKLRRLAAVDLPLDREIVAIDDGSTDGSAELVHRLMEDLPGLSLVTHANRLGRGTSLRHAMEQMRGDVAVLYGAGCDFEPEDLRNLLTPILEERADAVFGNRFARGNGACPSTWQSLKNRMLTTASNLITGVRLSDMETGCKVVRADVLRELRLQSHSFTFEPELVCRLAQWGARITEVPVQYERRNDDVARRPGFVDGAKAIGTLLHRRFIDSKFSQVSEDAMLRSRDRAQFYHRWMAAQVEPFVGDRVLDAGTGTACVSRHFLDRDRLVMADIDGLRVAKLRHRFGQRANVRVEQAELEDRDFASEMSGESIDTVLCMQALQQVGADFLTLRNFYSLLQPGGRLIVVAPAEECLMNRMDRAQGNHRRYQPQHLEQLFLRVGFEVEEQRPLNRLTTVGWWVNGALLQRDRIGSLQSIAFDGVWRLANHVDRFLPIPASATLIVGRKPE